MASWNRERLLTMYFGDPDWNTLNAYAAEPFLLLLLMRRTGRRTPDAALRHIQREAAKVIKAHSLFVGAVQIVALRICSQAICELARRSISAMMNTCRTINLFIRFFMGMPSHLPRSMSAELKRQEEAQGSRHHAAKLN